MEKLALIVPQVRQQVSTASGFLSVDRRRAGAVAASILAHAAASHPPANARTDLRRRLDARSRKPVPPKITFGPPRPSGAKTFTTRTFTNSNRSGRVGNRDSTGSLPVRGLNIMKSSDPVPVITINEANPVVVSETVDIDMVEEDANQVSEVEELPHGFFHSTETFPDDVSGASDRHTAGVSMTRTLPGTSQSGSSDVGERRHSSSSRRRSRSPSLGPSSSGSRHSSMKRQSRSRKKESRRDHSLEAEKTIPGSTTIRSRLFSPDRKSYSSFPCSQRERRSPSSPRRRSRRDSRERRRDSGERRRDSRERKGRDHSRHRRDSRH